MNNQTLDSIIYRLKIRYVVTVLTALAIRWTPFRFDKTWRWADSGPKAWFYCVCCTFAANWIADDSTTLAHNQIRHWAHYL